MNAPVAPSRLLPVAAPPHDPYSVMLSGRIGSDPQIGWRVHRLDRVDLRHGAMMLSPAPASARWLSERSGSFGGLRPPANVALTSRGDIVLLDRLTGTVKLFDPCACAFAAVPCTARAFAAAEACALGPSTLPAPRDQLRDPRGIAICGSDLFIADRGHGRIVRFAIGGWIPRAPLRLPAIERATLEPSEWRPTGLAFDGEGQLVVSDPENGRVDVFSPSLRWQRKIEVEPGGAHLAIDCRDRILVVVEREFLASVADTSNVQAVEIDAGTPGFQWHTLQLSVPAIGTRLIVDVHAGDEPWSATELDDPQNNLWARWLGAESTLRALEPLSLGGRTGRFLRLRFKPDAGHVPATLVATARGARVLRLSEEGTQLIANARADLIDGFCAPPLCVEPDGSVMLPCGDRMQGFDERGAFVAPRAINGDLLERQGEFISTAIDSRIEACVWHRIELRGAILPGCSIEVYTATAEIELTRSELDSLPGHAWSRCEPARAMQPGPGDLLRDCSWDAIPTPSPGRYLWLRLVLRGDGRSGPCLSSALVEYPRISLRRYLPGVFGMDPVGADFTDRFAAVFERTLTTIETHLDRLPFYFDPLSAPATPRNGHPDFLSWLGNMIGIDLGSDWPEARRRHFIKEVARTYALRGTPEGLRRQLMLLLGFDTAFAGNCLAERPKLRCIPRPRNCKPCPPCLPAEPPPLLLEHFKLRRWLHVGRGRLGSDAELWGRRIVGRSELAGEDPVPGQAQLGATALNSIPDPLRDPFHVHAHKLSVFVPARVRSNPPAQRALEQLVAREVPAHVQADIRYVEPRFRVGIQSMIGLDSVVARTPLGVTLAESRLRQGTLLTGRPRSPDLEVGKARVGTTARLT